MKNSKSKATIIVVISLLLLTIASISVQAAKQMPPDFSFENERGDVLVNYPVGVINEQAAFAHHGGAGNPWIM